MSNSINNFFGVNLSPIMSFILLFAAVIAGVLLLIWIARRVVGGTFVSGGRGRQLRLGVMDATPVDSRRRLVLVRRDDVEHLILIGGPTDVVVEQNIRIDGPRETRSAPVPVEPVIAERPLAMTRPAEAPRAEPPRQAAPQQPLIHRPAPAPQTPAAPYMQPRPTMPPRENIPPLPPRPPLPVREAAVTVRPALQTASPAPAPSAAPDVTPPHPFAPAPRIEPAAAAARPEPFPAPVAPAKPMAETRSAEQDMDDSLLADLTESMSFDDDEISPEVSLEKEMESLLDTLDTKKDRFS